MQTVVRILLTFVGAVATYYFVYWFGGAMLGLASLPAWSFVVVAMLAALLAARFIWVQTQAVKPGLGKSIVLGALITGAVAFSIGFFGPIIFAPGANQGPLLGIFITGPLGVLIGAVGGAVYWLVRTRRAAVTTDDPAV